MYARLAFTTLLFAVLLSSASSAFGAEADEAQETEAVCQADITWTRQAEHQWVSEAGLILNLYNEADADPVHFRNEEEVFAVATPSFWNSENAPEAEMILEEMTSGEEMNVTDFFLSHGWRIRFRFPDPCSILGLKCLLDYPDHIYYLHRPAEDWVIDSLITYAQGELGSRRNPEASLSRIHFVVEGPYLPTAEGRFNHDGTTFWFSARDHDGVTDYEVVLDEDKESLELSNPETRFATLQSINDFFASCMDAGSAQR